MGRTSSSCKGLAPVPGAAGALAAPGVATLLSDAPPAPAVPPAAPAGAAAGWRGGASARGEVLAALDLGTNNCRLLVARPQGAAFRVVDAFSRIVRLGEGVGASGRLGEAAMARALEALRICAAKMRRRGVTRSRAVATEACRRAGNGELFRARVQEATGIELEVITPQEEARLALAGCSPLFDPGLPGAIVFDIGGGSTELAWRLRRSGARPVEGVISLPVGVVTLAERYGGDCFTRESYGGMVEEVAAHLDAFEAEHEITPVIRAGQAQMVGTSGTVTTLAGVLLDLPRYDRARVDGTFLEFAQVEAIAGRLTALDFEGRAAHPCIGRERADLVVAGCAILEAICRQWPVGRLRVADRGIREGILHGLMATRAAARP